MWRFRLRLLKPRMCRAYERLCLTLPDAVSLKRFFAARFDFIFGMLFSSRPRGLAQPAAGAVSALPIEREFLAGRGSRRLRRRHLAHRLSRLGQQGHGEHAALGSRVALRARQVRQVSEDTDQEFLTHLGVGDLAAAERDRELDLVLLLQERPSVLQLGEVVVILDLGTELHFLEMNDVLFLARDALALRLLVLELSVVHDAADRWARGRRNLDQIESPLLRHGQRVARGDDANLLSCVIDEPHLRNANALVDPRRVFSERTDGSALLFGLMC